MEELEHEQETSDTDIVGSSRRSVGADARRIMNGIIFRLRTGCQWNQLPKVYGDDSTVHRTFQRWQELGLFEQFWALLVERCAELGRINWRWQAVGTSMGKAAAGAMRPEEIRRIVEKAARNVAF